MEQADSFNFSEQASEHEDYLWGNAAFAYASKISESFADSGWVVNISGGKNAGGLVGDLSCVDYNLGAEITKIAGEVLITDAQEKEISEAGFLGLSPYKNEAVSCFFGCQSARKPEKYDTPEATSNAKMETMLAYMFPITRVAHYLKSIQRDNIGRFVTAPELEEQLKQWLHQYYAKKTNEPTKFPFSDYDVKVTEDPANPGWYNMDVWVQPRIILQGISGKLHLVAKVPGKE
jgi:type VI secretion system protein ImpC